MAQVIDIDRMNATFNLNFTQKLQFLVAQSTFPAQCHQYIFPIGGERTTRYRNKIWAVSVINCLAIALISAVLMIIFLRSVQADSQEAWQIEWQQLTESANESYRRGDYGVGGDSAERALALSRQYLGERHPNTITSLGNLAAFYEAQGRLTDARPLAELALRLSREVEGEQAVETLACLHDLAELYRKLAFFDQATELSQQALSLRRQVQGERAPETLSSANNLALLYKDTGRFDQAEQLYQQTLRLRRETFGDLASDTLESMHNLAALYRAQGRLGEAERYYEQALTGRRQLLGPDHPRTLTTQDGLAALYQLESRFDEARPLYQQALERRRQALGENHPDTLTSLSNLAVLAYAQGHADEAQALFQEVLDRRLKLLGERHSDVLLTLNNLAAAHKAQDHFTDAAAFYRRSLALAVDALGPQHPLTLTTLNNLAALKQAEGHFDQAVAWFRQAWEGRRMVLGPAHPDSLEVGMNLAAALAAAARPGEAAEVLASLEPPFLVWLNLQLDTVAGRRTRRLIQSQMARFQSAVLSLALAPSADPTTHRLAATVALRWRGMEGEREQALVRVARREPALVAQIEQIQALRSRLPPLFHGGDPRAADQVRRQLEAAEQALRASSPLFAASFEQQSIDVDRIAAALPGGQALLIVRAFAVADFAAMSLGSSRLAALLIRPGQPVMLADLGEMAASHDLYALLPQSLRDPLTTLDRLYVIPDGQLALMPFETVGVGNDPWLAQLDIRRLESGRELIPDPTMPVTTGALVMGDIDYDQAPLTTAESPPGAGESSDFRAAAGRGMPRRFAPLRFSRDEAKAIAALLELRPDMAPTQLLLGAVAEESRLRNLPAAPRVLHISTHGFFRPRTDEVDQPLLLAGLSLTGANRALAAYRAATPIDGWNDGILFALEVQALNLEGTELVVLSACETAQGVATSAEGVEGLARAFRIAGARHVLLTLKAVPDRPTRDLMIDFYRLWLAQERSDPQAALRAVKLARQRQGEDAEFWSSFILIGP